MMHGDEDAVGGRLVEVKVPPGPLGILLDDAGPGGGAYLDGFAAVGADERERGAVETSGRVPPTGSVLVRVNEYDLVAEGMTFAEIGQVLRDTSHLPRTLGFRVPHADLDSDGDSDDDDSDDDDDDSDDSDDDGEEVETDSDGGHGNAQADKSGGSRQRVSQGGVAMASAPATSHSSPSGVSSSSLGSWTAVRAPAASEPSAPASVPSSPAPPPADGPALVPTTALSSAAGHLTPTAALTAASSSSRSLSPSSMATLRPSHSLAEASAGLDDEAPSSERGVLRVQVPPGPLGLNLNGQTPDRAEVVGFVPLRDGQRGALESDGRVLPGARLVALDELDLSSLTLDEIRGLLGERGAQPRSLGFLAPPPGFEAARTSLSASSSAAAPRPSARLPSFTALAEDPNKRRKLELALVMRHDAAAIKRGQCWLMLSTAWLAQWVAFAAKGGPAPGPIANDALLADGWRERRRSSDPGRPDLPRAGLALSSDYRGVSPLVWSLLAELHGAGDAPLLPRFALDIYADGPSDAELAAVLREPRLKAAVLARSLRDACLVREST